MPEVQRVDSVTPPAGLVRRLRSLRRRLLDVAVFAQGLQVRRHVRATSRQRRDVIDMKVRVEETSATLAPVLLTERQSGALERRQPPSLHKAPPIKVLAPAFLRECPGSSMSTSAAGTTGSITGVQYGTGQLCRRMSS